MIGYNRRVRGIFRKEKKVGQDRQSFHRENLEGQAALSLVLLVGGTVVLIAATLFFLVLSFINSSFGFQAANQAWGLAMSGINDAMVQLSRDPSLASQSYIFQVGTFDVNVATDRGCSWNTGDQCPGETLADYQVQINASARVSGRLREVIAIVSVGPFGKVDLVSLSSLTSGVVCVPGPGQPCG